MTLNELLDNRTVIALISSSLGALITWKFQIINELGLAINKKTNSHDYHDMLVLHGKLSDAIRDVVAIRI